MQAVRSVASGRKFYPLPPDKENTDVRAVHRDKKSGYCTEVAVVERWPLVEVRLYQNNFKHDLQALILIIFLHLIWFSLICAQASGNCEAMES